MRTIRTGHGQGLWRARSASLERKALEQAAALLRRLGELLYGARLRLELALVLRHFYRPRPDDIFLVTYPKSGTTLLQMMLYQMTTRGEMDFPHINSVVPWIESLLNFPRWQELDSASSPRVFKSHLFYERLPSGAKLIYMARDPRDVAVSAYHHQRTVLRRSGEMEAFVDSFLADRTSFGSWFRHIESWWPHRNDPGVLFLHYEDVIADLEGTVRRVSRFCGIPLDEADLPRIVERCGFEFMKRYNAKFDPRMLMAELGQFIRRGGAGEGGSVFTPEQSRRLALRMQALAEKLGCSETEMLASPLRPPC